jgi:hypothetical protein
MPQHVSSFLEGRAQAEHLKPSYPLAAPIPDAVSAQNLVEQKQFCVLHTRDRLALRRPVRQRYLVDMRHASCNAFFEMKWSVLTFKHIFK